MRRLRPRCPWPAAAPGPAYPIILFYGTIPFGTSPHLPQHCQEGRSTMHILAFIALGLAAGTLSGLLGVGGGIIIVPVLNQVFHVPMPVAVGTSLLIIIPTALVGSLTHYTKGNLQLQIALPVMIGTIAGGYLGARLAGAVPELLLKRLFALLALYTAFRMFFDR
ncbi:MAG TPA: sulfite exporter TauE/SafE family protein [Limnochordales bacterium]|nr:sulfite exporter TauE/SafE family protein [Limnochordales bacterium]